MNKKQIRLEIETITHITFDLEDMTDAAERETKPI